MAIQHNSLGSADAADLTPGPRRRPARGYARLAAWIGLSAAIVLAWSAPGWLVAWLGGGATGDWWRQAAFGATGLRILALLVGSIAGWWLVMALLLSLAAHSSGGQARGTVRSDRLKVPGRLSAPSSQVVHSRPSTVNPAALGVVRDQRGTAIIEFALLFPVALLLFLVIIQTALLYVGNFHVNHAAFRAARAAIVWADVDDLGGDLTHTLRIGAEAERRIANAAAFTCVGISGTSSGGATGGSAAAHDRAWQAFLGFSPRWSGDKFQRRVAYAAEHTRVTVTTMPRPDPTLSEFNALHQDFYLHREPITAHVAHDFELLIPYAKYVLGDTDNRGDGSGYRFIELRASYTLVHEGQPELQPGLPGSPGGSLAAPQAAGGFSP
ncbi:MAG: pilus assembly protein [Phycisphaerae bacterium]|nr:pilus assembly protein [Phycisphaerae bacterium]NUQ45976.1 pilus assembly protein [Phycisphaerae bacterium]